MIAGQARSHRLCSAPVGAGLPRDRIHHYPKLKRSANAAKVSSNTGTVSTIPT